MFITCWLIYKTEEWQMNMLHMHLSSSFTWHMRCKLYTDVNYKTLYFMEKIHLNYLKINFIVFRIHL